MPVGETFSLSGKRLQSFKVSKGGTFVPTKVEVTAPMIKDMTINGVSSFNALDLSEENALESVDVSGSGVAVLTLPETPTLKTVKEAKPTTLNLVNLIGLKSVTCDSLSLIKGLTIKNVPQIDVVTLLQSIKDANAPMGELVSLEAIDWTDAPMSLLSWLTDNNAKMSGKLTYKNATLTLVTKMKLIHLFGDIDNASNKLYVSYKKYNISSIAITGSAGCSETNTDYKFSLSVSPSAGNNGKAVKWELTDADEYATVDSETGTVHVKKAGTVEDAPQGTLKCTVTLDDNTTVTSSKTITFYDGGEYTGVQVGDIIFNDGSFGSELVNGKTAIGVCFSTTPRRMVALSSFGTLQWGIWSDLGVKLSDGSNPADISTIPNTDASTLAQTDVLSADFGPYKKNTAIPFGAANTVKIIQWRNKVLQDSAINLSLPEDSVGEKASLESLITAAGSKVSNGGSYYYSAASYCWAYSPMPGDESLLAKFDRHHWWLPTTAELKELMSVSKAGKFANAIKLGVMSAYSSDWTWSCQEYDGDKAYVVNSGGTNYYSKGHSYIVRAVAAF